MVNRRRALPETVLRHLADRATDYGLSRRAFLGLAGATGASALVAGCAQGGSAGSYRGAGGKPGYVRWDNYPLYIDQDDNGKSPTLTKFEAESGIHVLYYQDIDDGAKFTTKVRGRLDNYQDIGFDMVTLTDFLVKQWSDRGQLAPLDRAAMPNTQKLRPDIAHRYYDPDNRYSMPWQLGFPVIAWNKAAVPDGIRSVNDLWRPEFKGKVGVVFDLRETMGPIMRSLGTDPASAWGDPAFEAALGLLQKQIGNGQIMSVRGTGLLDLLDTGRAHVGIAYGGDVATLPDTLGYAIPDEGTSLWIDTVAAPVTTDQTDSVQKLIDYYYDPEVSATVSAYTYYMSPVDGARDAMKKVNPALVDNDTIFPSEETRAKLSFFREFTPGESSRYEAQFAEVIQSL